MTKQPTLEKCPYCAGTGHVTPGLGWRLRLLRARNDESQQEFANRVGITRSQIANLETGRGEPSAKLLARISDQYKVSTDWILGRET